MKIFQDLVETESVEKNSRFIAIGCFCPNLAAFETIYDQLKSRFSDASHITYAYKIIDNDSLRIRFSDDGEPSGTAGKPILNHVEGSDLINCAIFVVRYFGGVKLGAGGLVRAYGNAAKDCLSKAILQDYIEYHEFSLTISYENKKQLDYALKKSEGMIKSIDYSDTLMCTIKIPKVNKDIFNELFSLTDASNSH